MSNYIIMTQRLRLHITTIKIQNIKSFNSHMIHIEKQEVCNLDHWVSENSERPLMLPATRKTQHPNKFRKVRINFLKLHNEGRNFFHTDPSASIHLLGLVCAKKNFFQKICWWKSWYETWKSLSCLFNPLQGKLLFTS